MRQKDPRVEVETGDELIVTIPGDFFEAPASQTPLTVEHAPKPVLFTADGQPLRRKVGF